MVRALALIALAGIACAPAPAVLLESEDAGTADTGSAPDVTPDTGMVGPPDLGTTDLPDGGEDSGCTPIPEPPFPVAWPFARTKAAYQAEFFDVLPGRNMSCSLSICHDSAAPPLIPGNSMALDTPSILDRAMDELWLRAQPANPARLHHHDVSLDGWEYSPEQFTFIDEFIARGAICRWKGVVPLPGQCSPPLLDLSHCGGDSACSTANSVHWVSGGAPRTNSISLSTDQVHFEVEALCAGSYFIAGDVPAMAGFCGPTSGSSGTWQELAPASDWAVPSRIVVFEAGGRNALRWFLNAGTARWELAAPRTFSNAVDYQGVVALSFSPSAPLELHVLGTDLQGDLDPSGTTISVDGAWDVGDRDPKLFMKDGAPWISHAHGNELVVRRPDLSNGDILEEHRIPLCQIDGHEAAGSPTGVFAVVRCADEVVFVDLDFGGQAQSSMLSCSAQGIAPHLAVHDGTAAIVWWESLEPGPALRFYENGALSGQQLLFDTESILTILPGGALDVGFVGDDWSVTFVAHRQGESTLWMFSPLIGSQ